MPQGLPGMASGIRHRSGYRPRSRRVTHLVALSLVLLVLGGTGWQALIGSPQDPTPTSSAGTGVGVPAADRAGAGGSGPDSAGADPVARCAVAGLSRLDLRGRAAQLVMVGVPAEDPGTAVSTIRRHRVGGVFLAGRSSRGTDSVRRGVGRLQAAAVRSSGVGLSVAVDQEGGQVQTLTGAGFSTLPSASEQQGWSTARLGTTWERTGRQLRAAGVTMNLAPVADTVPAGTERLNPPIGAVGRHYGRSPGAVGTRVGVVAAGLEANGVAATLKHFPGLGRVRRNTDTSAGAVDSRFSDRDPHLEPFVEGIRAGADVVMVSSASYPRLDPERPAVFSPLVIDGLLRDRLGYRGVVLSDDLGAAAAVRRVPLGQRAVRFVEAGGDQTLSVRTTDAGPLVDALVRRARHNPGFRSRVDAAALRVMTLKADTGVLDCARPGVAAPDPAAPGGSPGQERADQRP